MSREGANNRIDSIKNSLNTDQYSRSALGNAVRFNTMLNVLNDFSEAQEQNSSRTNKFTLNNFSNSLERSVSELREDFDNELLDEENNNVNRRFDSENTIQQKLSNRAYKTSLGQTVANSTVQRKGMYQDFNTSYSTGATGAFRSFTNGFVQDDEDFFGSRVLYDNVFGQYEDGGESLSSKARIAASDPTNDTRTVSEKVLDNVVNKSIYDQTEIVDRVDIEFGRFHGNSMIDQMSMTGSGLKAARQTIRTVMQEGSAYGRQVAARGEDDHPIVLAQALSDRTGNDIENVNTALNLLNNNLSNRSSTTNSPDGGYVNKAGVAEFIDLINSAGTRDSNGSLTGGKISISTFQFQNETISAALTDKIQRHVLESVLQGGGAPLEIDIALAYPRQRNADKRQDAEGRYAVGMTNYSILGPNLIEALKMEEVKIDIQDMLVGLGVPKEDISKYVNLNIGFRDKKFHPKVYLTDNVASIGTQNLTAPVGSSVNQAGSNFETMRFVTNTFKNDSELEIARESFVPLGQAGLNQVHNNQITQSLLYRQIVDSVNQERLYSEGNNLNRSLGSTSTPILNNKTNSQVGFAGDIYQHLSNTLDFAHRNAFTDSQPFQVAGIRNNNSLHMFMVLDQSFMLQLGSNSAKKLLDGEMGDEIGTTPYDKDNIQAQRYRAQQNKLFDLLITDKANVVVDTKNFEKSVLSPLLNKINEKDKETGLLKNQKLKSNFEKYGQSFSMMAGFELLKPTGSANSDEYNKSLNVMFKELRRLGFTKEAGFEEDDLKQIIGLASNNIERANVPKQHAKEFGLFDYSRGSAELVSYYQGSSNMGLYSLGIESGEDGRYMPGDGNLTNTEMGIMLGRRDIDSNLSRATQTNLRLSPDYAFEQNIYSTSKNQWALNKEEEEYELMLAQRHFSTTWSQLARTNLESIKTKQFSTAPSWQENVNTKDLVVLKTRLETMSKDLGLSPDIFTITEKYGDKSGTGLTSINVSIDMNRIMSSTEFMKGTNSNLPRLNFELSVLQGPSRGEGMFHDSAEDGDVSGYVYFVDKNRVVGNGLFTNDSGKDVSILGRHKYEDNFENDIHKGRINLKSGQSAHMSSLDIVPQLFATLMGEAVNRFGTKESMKVFDTSPDNAANFNMASVKELLLNYVAVSLTGYSNQMDESIKEGSNIISSMKLIQDNLDIISLQDLNETINRHTRSVDNEMDSGLYQSKDPLQRKRDKDDVSRSLEELNNKWFHKLKGGKSVSEGDVEFYIDDLFKLAQKSPQLANMIVKTAYKDPNKTSKLLAFKEFQTLLFGSFLQTKDERTYGGQQGFYKTLLMGVGNSTIDKNTADLMFDLDTEKEGLHNLNAYARFKPLEYTPLTDIHDVLYRSIASKSTSLTKNDDRLDSIMFESEARDLGDAANLRLMSSLGIGSVLNRDDFIRRNETGEREIGSNQKEIFEAMERAMIASGSDPTAINNARQMYLDTVEKEFGDLDSEDRKDTIRLRFYTGNAKKLSQLPQRIKNAMGARPMYQFSIDAQMALERGESLNELSDNYLQQYRQPIVSATKNKVERLLEERERLVSQYGESHERVTNIDNQIDDLKIIGSKAFNSKVSGLGAIFSGRIKSVLNQEQINFITKTKERLQASMGDLIQQGELSQSVLDELIRVEVLKAGITNKGLGKMIVGNNHMNYGMAFIQLSGTYNDTSLNNPLYGTVYHSKDKYDSIRKHGIDIYDNTLSAMDRDYLGVYTLGQKEGHYDTKQESIKSSMIGAGGMELLLQADDIIVEDKNSGNFVHKRKVNGEWIVIGQVDDSRNVQSVRNVVDRTGFSEVGSTTIGSSTMSAYGRKGENSVDYIYTAENRAGVFANNEYLLTFDRIRAMDPGSARRVEGTDSGALIKAVATFAGRVKYSSIQNNSLANREMNVFENIEEQIMKSYEAGEIKGSLKAYLDARDETQRVTLQDGRTGYAPLSSSIHGLYNANNFKSFFWSHGATILRAQTEDSRSFMLDSLFDTSTDKTSVDSAKKLAGALLVNFGTDFLQTKEANNSQENITQLKRSLISEMIKGEFGSHYQGVVLEQTRVLGGRVEEIFSNEKLRKGRNKEQIASDLLYEKIGNQVGFNASKVGALSAVSSEQLSAVLKGDSKASADLLNLVRQGIMDPVAKQAQAVGGINFNNSAHTQAALIVTAVDLMHQISSKGSKLKIASDIDFDNDKVKDILLTVLGSSKSISDEETEDIMQFLSGVNSNVSTISVFTDIVFSYSKDATSTQSVARHEGQHLITPFLGDIKKYQEGGKLSHIQHTVASITAMVTGQESGMVFYDQMAKAGFKDKQAIDLTLEESNYLFSSFNKATYLGFYQSGVSGATTDNYVKEYKSINKLLLEGDYDWDSIQTIRDANDRTKFADEDESRLDFDEEGKPGPTAKAYAQVQRFVNKFHANESDLQKARRVDDYLMMGGDKFALHQLNELTTMMSIENARYQADPNKSTGRDTVNNLLKSMTNKRQYFSLPELSFEMQNGEIITRAQSNKLISTILPSAEEMRVLGAEYADFVDPILGHYKNLAAVFVPGTIANTAFEKVRLAARDNRAIVLSTEEYKAMSSVMDSARMMVPELAKASASSRTQEAFAGKNKYQGFTSTGIGNLLMPFDSVALAQSKLDEVGMTENLERFELMRQSDLAIKAIEEDRSYYIADDYRSPLLSEDPWLDSVTGKTIPHSNSIDYKGKPELRSSRLLPPSKGPYFTQDERFGPTAPIKPKSSFLQDDRLGPQVEAARGFLDFDFLTNKFNEKGIAINYRSDLQEGVAGEYVSRLGFINIDDNMSVKDKTSTLLHELVHVYQEKNNIPLLGLQKHSNRANPEIHGSKAIDSNLNLKEWQAYSIEQHYNELQQKDPKKATEFLNKVISTFDSGDQDVIKTTLSALGYKSELSDEYKQFTKYDIYSQLDSEDSTFFSKKEGKRIVQVYSRTPTSEWGKADDYVWGSSNIESTKNFGDHLWILEVELKEQGRYIRGKSNKRTWGIAPSSGHTSTSSGEWWLNFRGSDIVKSTYIGEINENSKAVTSPDDSFFHDAWDNAVSKDLVDIVSEGTYWGRSNIQSPTAKMGLIEDLNKNTSVDLIQAYLVENERSYIKLGKTANKYKSKILKDSTRENETEWQYVIRSFLDLDGSEKSSYIGQILEDRILGKELRDLPSEYEYLKDEIDTFQKKLNKESSKLEGYFQTAYDFTTKENKPFTLEEVLKQTSDAVYYSKKINQSNEEPAFFDNAKVVVDGDEEVNTNQKSIENVAKVLDSTSIKDINPLGKNIINFYRRQKAAEAFGISKDLEKEFDNIKREAIETKNKISGFANVAALNADERKAAFDQLYSEIKNKKDIAYAMSSLDEKTGDSLSNKKNEYSSRVPSEADKYIYHAQALNYDAMLAEISLIGHQANLRPLTEQNVQDLERKRKKLSEVEFLLNSNQDVDKNVTFSGLGKKQSNLSESALFVNKAISPDGGMVGQHMKAINSLSSEMRGLGMSKEATQIKNQYAVQQIDATIKMYEKRMEEMQAFSAERSVHSSKRNEKGELIIDEAVQRKIDSASSDYTNNTQKVIEYLKDKKSKFMSGVTITDQDIRNTFEDIDVKIAEVDTANIRLAEVFRSPTPGGTDPRLHTYRVMQGVAALNQVSNMLSDNRQIGAENKMIYSTERGQTATMMASLGVITYGGGDFDGDPYTVIFHQAADMQKLIQQKQSIVDQRKLTLDNVVKKAEDLKSQINKIVVSDGEHLKQRERLEEALKEKEEQIEQIRNNLYSASNELNEAKNNFERQITDGHKGLQARARKQVANYMGLDERLFVSNKEIMFDTNGKVILDEDGQAQRGLNNEKTYDADAMFVFMEQGYKLMEGVESKNTSVLKMMDTVDLLTGYKTSPDVFQDGNFLKELTSRENLVRSPNGKISDESPAIGMLKNRVAQLQNTIQQLTPEQQQFVNNLKDADNDQYRAYLEQFNSLQKDMEGALSLHNLENQQKAEDKQKEFSKKAFMNQWIGGNIYSGVMANDTLNKFMVQGGGMTLTEGSFDMTLKTLGKAGGEVLGKTYNTIIGTTFQDAPVISYGRQMMDESSELHSATRTEFQNQSEGNTERRQIAEQNALSRGLERGTKKFDNAVRTELRSIGYSEFDEYVKVTQKAVLKSEGTQGFMKNIHQLLRDSIKLKDGDGDLQNKLQEASEEYDRLSKQISMNDEQGGDPTTRKDLLAQRDSIIGKMASNLGPGPGLKSLIDLDYLTNESSKTGLSRNEFESRFLTKGGIDSNRQMLNHYAASMDNLTEEERGHLLDPSTITEESGALLKVARNMTANNIANMVTSFRMSAIAVEGRGEIVRSFANSHKAKLATQLGHHTAVRPEGVMQDGIIEGEDQTGKYIKEKYGVIEAENNGAKFDVNRMHKNALGAHLGLEEAHLYNEDGTMSVAYRDKLEKASKKLNISTEEYVLMFDIHHETSREQVKGVFGEDGKQMEQFTVMNMMRKDIARSMLDGRVPGAEASKIINESMGSEVLTTMAQLASTNKLDSKGMEIFSSMYKGAIGYMLEATDGVVDVTRKSDGEIIQMKFSEMNAQQKQAYMTKLLHQQMLGTEASQESGFTRSTSQESRDFKNMNARVIANSKLIIDDMDGTLNGKLGNEFIDALDKAGANTLTGQQQEMYDAMSQEFVRSALDNDEEFDSLMRLSLPGKGDNVAGRKSDAEYRAQMKKKVRAQMKIRQEQDSKKYATSRSRHSQGRSVMNRSSFMNTINSSALDQLTTTAGSNALDLFVPLALTAVGSVIQDGSVDGEQLMQLGGASFTAFQYARTGTIESTTLSPDEYKKRLLSASAVGGIFKFKNALMKEGDENVGAAVASVAVQEVTAAAFNTIATPWLSKNIAEHGLGVKHGPAMNALDMKKYQAGQQLAGNLGASLISAVSSTLISGLLMRGVESMSQNVGDAIQSFLPAVQAVSSVNESIAKRRQQEAAYEDFEAETDNSEGEVRDYMVMTEATYDPNDYNSMADLQEAQEVEPSNDGSLSIGLLS